MADPEPVKLSFDKPDALHRCGDDEDSLREMVRIFRDTLPKMREDIREAFGKEDRDEIVFTTHAMGSAANSISARAVGENARALEEAARKGADLDTLKHRSIGLESDVDRLDAVLVEFLEQD